MGKLNMKDWIDQTIQNKKTIAIPIMTHPTGLNTKCGMNEM